MADVVTRTRAEVWRLWIDALRSGQYKQTIGQLRSESGYCCLGVLCDLARRDGGPTWGRRNLYTYNTYMGESISLPPQIANFMDLSGENRAALMRMNDRERCSFLEIANWLEAQAIKRGLIDPS